MRHPGWREAALVVVVATALYVPSGTLGAYLARDDFQWLNGARSVSISTSFVVEGRTHFYRPVAELWWTAAYRVCGMRTACYHGLELGAHIANALLFMFLSWRVFRRHDVAVFAAVLFVLMPAYVQAVLWVCAVTTLWSVVFYLTCLHLALSAATRDRAGWHSALAVAAAAAALYTHESSATLAFTVPLVVGLAPGTRRYRPRVLEILLCAALAVGFVSSTVTANSHNYVFTEGHYAAGRHAFAHGLDYIRALYIGRRALPDYVGLALAASAIVLVGTRVTRTGLAWMLLTMLPFLSFTWGNVGRYTYLPAMGFAWIVAGVVAVLGDRLEGWLPARAVQAVVLMTSIAVGGRFAAFSHRDIRGQIEWMETYRRYLQTAVSTSGFKPETGEVVVPAPPELGVEREYVEPMLQWELANPALVVRFADRR
jgi:hypothetical protein